jgi:hypothetical protein
MTYPPTFQAFLPHWAQVDAALGAGHELALPDGLTLPQAQALHATLLTRMAAARSAAQDVVLARGRAGLLRGRLRDRLEQFAGLVRAYWAGTPWAALLPGLPPLTCAPEKFLKTCRKTRRLWTLLEAEPAPPGAPAPIFLDPGGVYGRADFTAQVEELDGLFEEVEAALWARAVELARRDALLERVKSALMAYTRAVAGRLPPGHALVELMPPLWPPPGHTPDPVALSGAWDAQAGVARLSWEASEDAMLSHYELWGCAGADFDTEAAERIARVEKDAPREVLTHALLMQPGAVASFRVWVVLETGNEKASEAVVVVRG